MAVVRETVYRAENDKDLSAAIQQAIDHVSDPENLGDVVKVASGNLMSERVLPGAQERDVMRGFEGQGPDKPRRFGIVG